jgi:BirA family biotin operon repressor/biotin-[acetyl-CoA-carboxylase] ligase
LILRPTRPLAEAASLSLVVGVALAEAVERLSSAGKIEPRLKWPNDVQIGGAKVAGILLEGASDHRGGCLSAIVGIGVNLISAPGADVGYATTHLAACGLATTPRSVLLALAGTLRPLLDRWERKGFEPVREAWLARAAGVGAPVGLKLGHRTVAGRLVDVDATGALRLEHASGEVERFAAGEVVLG